MTEEELKLLVEDLIWSNLDRQKELGKEVLAAFAELRAECDAAIGLHGLAIEKAQEWQGKCFALQRERDLLREAVDKVEWVGVPSMPTFNFVDLCMWCNSDKPNHAPDCLRQRARGVKS